MLSNFALVGGILVLGIMLVLCFSPVVKLAVYSIRQKIQPHTVSDISIGPSGADWDTRSP